MDFPADTLHRLWEDLLARPTGPMAFRFILQPAVSAILAIRDGIEDAKAGRSPYFWTVVTNRAERKERLREGLAATSKIIVLALVLDAAYQILVLGRFYPGEAIIIALVLGFVPYLLVRGPAARIARRVDHHDQTGRK